MSKKIIMYLSEENGILLEENNTLKKYKGETFSNEKNINKYMEEWGEDYFFSSNKIDLLLFGENLEEMKKVIEIFKQNDIKISNKSEYNIEKIEEILLKYLKIENGTVIKVINKNKDIFLEKKENQFNRNLKNIKFDKEIFVINENENFFNVKAKKSKIIKEKKEKLEITTKKELTLGEILLRNLKDEI